MNNLNDNKHINELKRLLKISPKYQLNSSNLKSAQFKRETEDAGELEIEFINGSIYLYKNVEEYVFNSLKSVESPGRFFRDNIKEVYRYERIK